MTDSLVRRVERAVADVLIGPDEVTKVLLALTTDDLVDLLLQWSNVTDMAEGDPEFGEPYYETTNGDEEGAWWQFFTTLPARVLVVRRATEE